MATLIWDFNGTLAYRRDGWSGALLSVLRRDNPTTSATIEQIRPFLTSGFPWHAPENPHPGQSATDWWDELRPLFARALRGAGAGDSAYRLAGQVRTEYLEPRTWQRFEDSLPTLDMLKACGWRHILLTNHAPELEVLLSALGFTDSFAAVFCSAETGYEKPHPKAFRSALDMLDPGESVYLVGDSYSADVRGAMEVGLQAVLVRTTNPESGLSFPTLGEFAAWLNSTSPSQ